LKNKYDGKYAYKGVVLKEAAPVLSGISYVIQLRSLNKFTPSRIYNPSTPPAPAPVPIAQT